MTLNKIKLFKQASEFTSFHKKLAILIEPYIEQGATLLDAGCGIGILDFEIASKLKSITAVDISEEAIEDLNKHIEDDMAMGRDYASRINPICADTRSITGEWDIVMLSFYGMDLEETERLIKMARRRAILLVHAHDTNTVFDPAPELRRSRISANELETFLVKGGYRYRKLITDMQFGQPFRTIEDIHEFLDSYSKNPEADSIDTSALEESVSHDAPGLEIGNFDIDKIRTTAEERIIKTDRYDYPYYLPRNFSVGIFVLII